ncbi:MAG: peptidyl-prolyl cis-trans isomerase [Spirochaetaceae bacterium]
MRKNAVKRIASVAVLVWTVVAPASAQVLDQPVAVVRLHETVNIGQREMREQERLLERQLGRDLSSEDRRELLEAQINEVLITQAANQRNLRVREEELRRAIAQQRASVGQPVGDAQFRRLVQEQIGLSWEEYEDQIRQRLIQEKFIMEEKRSVLESIEPPSEREIRGFYEENATRFTNPTMVRFRHVFVDTRNLSDERIEEKRERAQELYRSLERGDARFEELMDAAMDDASYSAGDFGYIMRQNQEDRDLLGRDFIESVFALEEGEISDGILESNVGFHIVEVTNRRPARVLGLDDPVLPGESTTVRDQVRNYLLSNQQQRAFQRALQEVVEDLRAQAEADGELTVYEENLDW